MRPCRHFALFHMSLIDVWYLIPLCMYIRSFHGVIMRGTALLRSLRDMGKGSGKNFYAVKAGRAPGQIFRTWSECEAQVPLVLDGSPEPITGPPKSSAARSIQSSAFSCDIQVKGFKGAQYKGFKSESEALTYLEQSGPNCSLSISQHSRDILKKRQRSLQAQSCSAALSPQYASGSAQGCVHPAASCSMQTCSNASHSTRPCADPQQLYSMVSLCLCLLCTCVELMAPGADCIALLAARSAC